MSRPTGPAIVRFEPKGTGQVKAARLWESADVLFLLGAAGTGKTHTALGLACGSAVAEKTRVTVVRPVVEVGRSLGFLKGTLDEKLAPWAVNVRQVAASLVFGGPQDFLDVQPLSLVRGRTFDQPVVVDEAQNCTADELYMLLTRIGKRGRVILSGDPHQADLPNSGLMPWARALKGLARVAIVVFPDHQQHRNPLVTQIIKRRPRECTQGFNRRSGRTPTPGTPRA